LRPLTILERLALVVASTVFAGFAARARYEADQFGLAAIAVTLFLLALCDVILWWGCC
jgi:hypothetical protein